MRYVTVLALLLATLVEHRAVSADAGAGREIFRARCASCHAVRGEGGSVGPDLAGIFSRRGEQYLEDKLLHPDRLSPDTIMPAFLWLPEADFRSLLDYLRTLR